MNFDPKTVDAARKLKKNLQDMFQAREKFAGASREFQSRYFSWSLGECTAEFDRDFSLVRLVQDISTSTFFSFIESLTPKEKGGSLIALCKGMHYPEALSEPEFQLNERYREHWSMPLSVRGSIVSALRTTPHQLEIQERYLRRAPSNRMITQLLRKRLKIAAAESYGRMIEDKPSILAYERPIGAWYVVTSFEFLSTPQLRYTHQIHAFSGGNTDSKIYDGISVLNWTGIHADSTWSWLLPEDVPSAANAIHQLCVHFLRCAEGLLDDLPRGA